MSSATTSLLAALLLVTTALPAWATPDTVRQGGGVVGAPDGDQTGSRSFDPAGPTVPGPDYIEPFDEIESPSRSERPIGDSAGHVLVQGRADLADGTVDRLVALNATDGSVDWVADDIEQDCQPVATDDGRIFATLVANSPTSGVNNSSSDPVELDAETGQISNRFTSPDDDVSPRLNECRNELRLGSGGILMAITRADDYAVVGIDTTTNPMSEAWRYGPDDRETDANLDQIVLSPDGRTLYTGDRVADSDPRQIRLTALDVADGSVAASAVVPGTRFTTDGMIHTGERLLLQTQAVGGADDPPRLMSLDPDTLDQDWLVEGGGEDDPFDRTGGMALANGVVVIHASGTLLGFDVTDGSRRWTHRLSSFSNNGSQVIADGAGKVYASTFGGSPLEIVAGDTGDPIFISPDTEDFLGTAVAGEATFGPVLPDGRLYALHRVEGENTPALVAYGNGDVRLDGVSGDPIDIAIQLCQYLFGDDQARTVVLARDDVFADTLAGAPLAGDHSCILFTPGGPDAPIDERTLDEIARALPDGATVRVVGGTNAVSEAAASAVADAGFAVERLAGPGRVDTAVAISDVVVAENPGVTTAVVAFANNWPDAVTAGAWAAATGSPVLLTGTEDLPAQSADALQRYGTATTQVPGGTAVVGDGVLAQVPGGQRVAGQNRYGTAAQVAEVLWAGLANDDAFVLSNLEFDRGWALALAASPLSVRLGAPQLGVRATSLPPETETYLVDNGVTDPGLVVLGDLTVIDGDVVAAVEVTTSG